MSERNEERRLPLRESSDENGAFVPPSIRHLPKSRLSLVGTLFFASAGMLDFP